MTLGAADLLRFLVDVALLLALARGLGEVARRLGQPQVIGETLAGVALGPSLLGALLPGVGAALFPPGALSGVLLQLVADIGVILLLQLSGMETDVAMARRRWRSAGLVTLLGMMVPFIGGLALASLLPAGLGLHGSHPVAFAAFLATAVSLTSISVLFKILLEMDLMRRDIGQLALAASMLTDSTGYFLLAVVAGLSTAQALPVARLSVSMAGTVVFAVFLFTLGYGGIRRLLAWVDRSFGGDQAMLSAVVAVGLAGAAVTQALHVQAFLGSFLVGVQLSRIPRVGRAASRSLRSMTMGVFAPVFFASAGLAVDLPRMLHPAPLVVAGLLLLVACAGKFAGTFIAGRFSGLDRWKAAALGAGMNARGLPEIVVATIALQSGAFSATTYSMVVVVAMATSFAAPPALRACLQRMPADPSEEGRLRREAAEARSFLHGVGRVLVPIRDGRFALYAAQVVAHLAARREVDVTALHVRPAGGRVAVPATPPALGEAVHWHLRTVEPDPDVPATVLQELERGYDLIVLGASDVPGVSLFGGVTDRLVAGAPCPVFVVRLPASTRGEFAVRRILLPTAGTAADQHAGEFAVALARGTRAEVVALHVVEVDVWGEPGWTGGAGRDALLRHQVGHHSTAGVRALGELMGVAVRAEVRTGGNGAAGREIVGAARAVHADLVLLAADRRLAGREVYCGRTVEYVVRHADCPVAVLFPTGLDGRPT